MTFDFTRTDDQNILLILYLDFRPSGGIWQIGWYLHVNCDIDEHRHKLSCIIRTRLGNALIKHQVLEMVGSEVANKINNKRHLLLKIELGKGNLNFIILSFGTNLALDTQHLLP